MRPIDTIRNKIDSDLNKYHSTTLCKISNDNNIKNIRGIGLCALVTPVNKYNELDPTTLGEEKTFPVIIVNRPQKWLESNISGKFYVMTLNPINDKTAVSLGFLVSRTALSDINTWRRSASDQSSPKDENGKPLESSTEEFITHD